MADYDGVIRAKQIELEDGNGNVRVVLNGGSTEDGHAGMIVYGPDGPVSALSFGFIGSSPSVYLDAVGGASVQIIFTQEGRPIVHLRDANGHEKVVAP